MAWLTGYSYRKSFTIARASGALTDYPMPLRVYRSWGTDGTESVGGTTGGKIYVGTLCEADYDDIRITTSDGETLLDCWIEEYDASDATLWVEYDSIGTSATTFYVYFGNAGASAYTNGDDTFIFFDHFTSLDDTKWPDDSNNRVGTPSQAGTELTLSGQEGVGTGDFSYGPDYRVHVRGKNVTTDANSRFGLSDIYVLYDIYADDGGFVDLYSDGEFWAETLDNSVQEDDDVEAYAANTYYTFAILFESASVKFYKDNTLKSTHVVRVPDSSTMGLRIDQIIASKSAVFDWVFLADYRSTEPAWGSWGGAETRESISGGVNIIGVLGESITLLQALSASVAIAGEILGSIGAKLSGAVSSAGALVQQLGIELSGTVTSSGAMKQTISVLLSGTMAISGALGQVINVILSASTAISGALSSAVAMTQSLSGSVAIAGSLVKAYLNLFIARVSKAVYRMFKLGEQYRTWKDSISVYRKFRR